MGVTHYQEPELIIVRLEEDVIRTSGGEAGSIVKKYDLGVEDLF